MARREFTVANEYVYDRRSPLRWIGAHIARYPVLVFLNIVGVLASSMLLSFSAVLVGRAFDVVLNGRPIEDLLWLALAVLVVRVVQGSIGLAATFAVETMAQRVERDAREELYISLLGKSLTFHNRQRVGDVMARATNDVQQLNLMLNPGFSLVFQALVELVVPLVTILTLKADLILVPILFLVGFFVTLRRYSGELGPVAGMLRMQFGEMNAGLAQAISGIEVVKAYAQEPAERARFSDNARKYRDLFVREGIVQARYLPLLVYGIALGLAFGHALILLLQGQITVGTVIAFMGLLDLLRFPTFISLFAFVLIQLGVAGADRILAMLRTETELDENSGGAAKQIAGDLQFENVSFGYAEEAPAAPSFGNWDVPAAPVAPSGPVLKGISFHARPGETIAIVGQTGSGKTTLTRLVNRIYDATEGHVRIDGLDVRDWSMDALRSQISTIEQDIFLFSRSIADNIAFGAAGVSREQIEWAARQACAHEFIMSFPDGYDTVIGERGVTLSGGQRQRIAIARAFLTNPRILILDDSTSAIDSATEDEIQRAMRHILKGRTTLLITHRLSQIRWADRILVLRRGELAAQGTHDELMETSDAYRRIFARYETVEKH